MDNTDFMALARALPARRLFGPEDRALLDLWTQHPSFNRFHG
jgi:hypothetical protein